MTAPTTANRGYAKGWSVNAANNWWHSGSLPGTATIIVRTASGFCWAALTNTRRPASDMDLGLDKHGLGRCQADRCVAFAPMMLFPPRACGGGVDMDIQQPRRNAFRVP
jgi:hypothetical protein